MGITSFGSGGQGGKYDNTFKKALIPSASLTSVKAWTTNGLTVTPTRMGLTTTAAKTAEISTSKNGYNMVMGDSRVVGSTLKVTTAFLLTGVTLSLHTNNNTNVGDIHIRVVELDANGNPDVSKIVTDGFLPNESITKDATYRSYEIDLVPSKIDVGSYALLAASKESPTNSSFYMEGYNADSYTDGNFVRSEDNDETWTHYTTVDMYFVLKSSAATDFTSGTAYVDFDLTGMTAALDTFSFTESVDGTNIAKADLTDINGNSIKESLKNGDSLASYVDYDTVRFKVTLDRNGSSNVPSVSNYSLKYLNKVYPNSEVKYYRGTADGGAAWTEVLNIQGSCKLYLASSIYHNATYPDNYLEVYIDGLLQFSSASLNTSYPIGIFHEDFIKVSDATKTHGRSYLSYDLTLASSYERDGLPTVGYNYSWVPIKEPIKCKESLVVKAKGDAAGASYGARYYIVVEV